MTGKHALSSVFVCAVLLLSTSHARAQQQQGKSIEGHKLAQTGMKFLSQSVDARVAALGNAAAALTRMGSTAMFYNPAAMAHMNSFAHVSLGRIQWIADISYNTASVAFRPAGGTYGVFGLSLMAVDYGKFLGTIRADNEQGFIDTGTYSPTAMAFGVGYALILTSRFSVGGHVKYAVQDLGASIISADGGGRVQKQRRAGTMAFDFGVLYQTGFRSLTFAVNVRNFSREVVYVEESFSLPLSVSVGFAVDVMELASIDSDRHSFLLTTDMIHPRDYPEQIKVGGEYVFMDVLALRAGYVYPTDEQGINLGAGIQTTLSGLGFAFDYAYTRFGRFGNVNRFSVALSF